MKKKFLPLAILALCNTGFAVDLPGAGSQMQQVPMAPELKAPVPDIRIEKNDSPVQAGVDEKRFPVSALRITGTTLVPEATLVQASGFVPGKAVSLSELRGIAAKVASYLQDRGYFLAQAYLPAQESQDGSVTIHVLIGQYGKVTVNNTSKVSDTLAHQITDGLKGEQVTASALERRLLLLSDLPGTKVSSILVPGASLGTSDLIVDVAPGARFNGSVDADNLGNRYTGRNRIGATLNANELLGYGDVASLRAFTSADGLNYARLSYQLQLHAVKIGAAFASMDYRLGKEFASLDAHGNAKTTSVYGSYPLIRSRNSNLFAQVSYDHKKFSDRADTTGSVTDKNADAWMFNLNGDTRDSFGGGGASYYALTWTHGKIDIKTPVARLVDDATVQSNGSYNKLGLSVTRLQNLVGKTMLYASLNAQKASKNLDVSEKMGLGGVGAVRAYPGGEAYGDEGYQLTLELRQLLSTPQFMPAGQLQLIGFVDTGTVKLNRTAWAGGNNKRTLSGAGLGLTWNGSNGLITKLYYAHKLGNEKATSVPDSQGRFWLQMVKYF